MAVSYILRENILTFSVQLVSPLHYCRSTTLASHQKQHFCEHNSSQNITRIDTQIEVYSSKNSPEIKTQEYSSTYAPYLRPKNLHFFPLCLYNCCLHNLLYKPCLYNLHLNITFEYYI